MNPLRGIRRIHAVVDERVERRNPASPGQESQKEEETEQPGAEKHDAI
jgi:hypothetical protein